MSITTRHIDVLGQTIAVHLAGKGPVALLVHGFPLDHRMWLDLLHSPLARMRTLAAVDLRGHGSSPWRGDNVHSMDLFAQDLQRVANTLSDAPVDVVGLSMGGYAALALVANHPECVRSLTLANTKASADSAAAAAARYDAIAQLHTQGRLAFAQAMVSKLVPASVDALLKARLLTMIEATPYESIVADLRGLAARPDRGPMLAQIRVPTLILSGALDAIATHDDAQCLATGIAGSKHVRIPDCGHMSPMEQSQQVIHHLAAHWDSLPCGSLP